MFRTLAITLCAAASSVTVFATPADAAQAERIASTDGLLASFKARTAADCRPLAVEVHMPAYATGSMHYAEELLLRAGDDETRLATDVARDVLAPIASPPLLLRGCRYLVVGWTSAGGSTSTIHALIVDASSHGVRLLDHLRVTGKRARGGIVVRERDGRAWIGVPGPDPSETADDPDGWRLETSRSALDASAVGARSLVPWDGDGALHTFGPVSRDALETDLRARPAVLWLAAGAAGFVPAP